MNKLLGNMVKFVSQLAMLFLWAGLIAWCIMFMLNQWKQAKEQILPDKFKKDGKKFYVINGEMSK